MVVSWAWTIIVLAVLSIPAMSLKQQIFPVSFLKIFKGVARPNRNLARSPSVLQAVARYKSLSVNLPMANAETK